MLFGSANEKFEKISKVREDFMPKAEEYKEMKASLELRIKERDTMGEEVKEEF